MAQELIISTADLAVVITDYTAKATDLLEQGERAVIDSNKSDDNGTDFMKVVSGIDKKLDDWRLSMVGDYKQRARLIDAQCKTVSDLLKRAKKIIGDKKLVWYNAEEKRKRAEAEIQRRESEEASLDAAQKAEEAGDAATSEAILNMAAETPPPDVKPDISRGSLTGAAAVATKVWTARVDNVKHVCKAIAEGHLPEDLVEFPKSKLNALARDWHEKNPDAKEIEQHGINVSSETRMSVR